MSGAGLRCAPLRLGAFPGPRVGEGKADARRATDAGVTSAHRRAGDVRLCGGVRTAVVRVRAPAEARSGLGAAGHAVAGDAGVGGGGGATVRSFLAANDRSARAVSADAAGCGADRLLRVGGGTGADRLVGAGAQGSSGTAPARAGARE